MSENLLGLNRDQLSKALGGNYTVIRAFEQIVNDIGGFPSTVEEANALAGTALAVAQTAFEALSVVTEMLSRLESAQAVVPVEETDDTSPRVHLGTLSVENADDIETDLQLAAKRSLFVYTQQYGIGTPDFAGLQIFCGAGDTIRLGHRDNSNVFTEDANINNAGLVTAKQFYSAIGTGSPPLVIASTTKVNNLYVDRAANADHATAAGTADSLTNPTTYPPAATDAASTQTLVNALRAAAIAKGL